MKTHHVTILTFVTLLMILLLNLGVIEIRIFACVFFGVGLIFALRSNPEKFEVAKSDGVVHLEVKMKRSTSGMQFNGRKVVLDSTT